MAQSVKCPTLDFGSGHDLTARESKSLIGLCTHNAEASWYSVSLSLCPSPACSISIKINTHKLKREFGVLMVGKKLGLI